MPAIGDLRNRLLALADVATCGEAIVRCLETRLPADGNAHELRQLLISMADPEHQVWEGVAPLPAKTLQDCLHAFLRAMPADFDARQASLGNVCMAGKYLLESRSLGSVLPLFGRLLHVRGRVVPIVEESLHLAARLEDGTLLVGQHLFKYLQSPVRDIFLTVYEPGRGSETPVPCRPRASAGALARLREASLVCYPMGSFFSSVLANLLADGIGHCVSTLACPKIFIPNTGRDTELLGCSVVEQLRNLVRTLQKDAPGAKPAGLVSHILVDKVRGVYQGRLSELEQTAVNMGITVLDAPVVRAGGLRHDAGQTAHCLISLAEQCRGLADSDARQHISDALRTRVFFASARETAGNND